MKRLALALAFFVACAPAASAVGPIPFDVINLTTGIRYSGAAPSGNYVRGNGTNFVSAAILAGDLPVGFVDAVGDIATGLCTASQILKKNAGNTAWECAADALGGSAPFVDTTSIVEGSVDATKEIRFEVDGLTTATVRVLTPPDANIVLAGSASALTSGRIPVVTTGGLLTDTANLTWDNTNFRLRGQNLTTAADDATNMAQLSGTLPTIPTTGVHGGKLTVTSAGSAAQSQSGIRIDLLAGYTGSSFTASVIGSNQVAGTAATLGLNSTFTTVGNFGLLFDSQATTAGHNHGVKGEGLNSTSLNSGLFGKAADNVAGTNIGVLGNAANSTEATDLKNVPGFFTLRSALPVENLSMALGADNGATTDDMARFYDDGTVTFRFQDGGKFTSAGTSDLGWTPVNAANQACNTTCTSACIVGLDTAAVGNFLACADATADSCICAGSS